MAIADRTETLDVAAAAQRLETAAPEDILRWTVDQFGPDVAISCSFGGPSGVVLVDMLARLGSLDDLAVYFIDTGLLFDETHALRIKIEQRYGFKAVRYEPLLNLEAQAATHGSALWTRDPDKCCGIRRVAPNMEALRERAAWVSGLRRDQSETRANTPVAAWNAQHDLVKVAPLATWTEEMVWEYVRRYDVPVNELHSTGYPSLGCTVCTTPIENGEHIRSGRWRDSDKMECGLHWQI
jgi:phosphoadenosine phosphosulfate reductase